MSDFKEKKCTETSIRIPGHLVPAVTHRVASVLDAWLSHENQGAAHTKQA